MHCCSLGYVLYYYKYILYLLSLKTKITTRHHTLHSSTLKSHSVVTMFSFKLFNLCFLYPLRRLVREDKELFKLLIASKDARITGEPDFKTLADVLIQVAVQNGISQKVRKKIDPPALFCLIF